ncbi:hypothetical protein [Streptomyces sp. NBC_00091]|uniref:hypothetical protein n=1 Tax=Streptomyces sp. NBC_00091 TaxID=2975648 RepID=UPI00225BCBDA|nr:hypothetical protein [Streptomyces sp. NBC_00091]MCX5377386.1 hypothetical protein [Streptomyces sp. NBC_00091]
MTSRPRTATAFRAYPDSWARVDFHEQVKENPAPVLLLAGANDPALGPEAVAVAVERYLGR